MSIDALKDDIINSLTPYLQKTDKTFDGDILSTIVDGVIFDAIQIRRYPSTYPEELQIEDLKRHMGTLRNVVIARYSAIGAENETSHTEGEVSRRFNDLGKEWMGFMPLAVTV